MSAALALVRWVQFASTLLLFGSACFAVYAPAIGPRLRRRFAAVFLVLAAAALASALGWWVCEGGAMTGVPAKAFDPQTLAAVLTQTAFGHVWSVRLALAALALAAAALQGRERAGRRDAAALVAASGALLVSLAGTGHASSGTGTAGTLHQFEDAAHLTVAGVWSGGLLGLTILLGGTANDRGFAPDARAAAVRFSSVALVATASIVATGILRANVLVGNWEALVGTPYGRLLCAKIAAFALALAVAAFNRRALLQRAPAVDDAFAFAPERLRRRLLYEQLLLQVAILAVAIFGTLPPPADLAQAP